MTTSIAVVGAGMMGGPMARRLLDAGYDVTACDRSAAVLDAFDGTGAHTTSSAADCAGVDVVLVLVAKDADVEAVVTGADGLLGALGERKPVVVVMSTVSPATVRSLATTLAPHGVQLVDAPISGGETGAQNGTLSILAGGDREVLDGLAPVLDILGRTMRCGPLGAGSTAKIINNLFAVVNAFLGAEAYRIALDNGLDLTTTGEVVEASSGRNFTSGPPGPAGVYARWTQSRDQFAGLTSIMKKDLGLARSLAAEARGAFPLVEALTVLVAALDGDGAYAEWRAVAGSPA